MKSLSRNLFICLITLMSLTDVGLSVLRRFLYPSSKITKKPVLGTASKFSKRIKPSGQEKDIGEYRHRLQSCSEVQKLQSVEKHLTNCADSRRVGDWRSTLREVDAAIASGADASPQARFDDVQKPPALLEKAPRERKELDENKSTKGLAEVYELGSHRGSCFGCFLRSKQLNQRFSRKLLARVGC